MSQKTSYDLRPLMREVKPAAPYPIDSLGPVLAPAARAIHEKTRGPLAICAQSVLAAGSLSVQAHANVQLPTGQQKPLSNFFLTVAASGERKTAIDTEALAPVRHREQELQKVFDAEHQKFVNKRTVWDRARQAVFKRADLDGQLLEEALEELGVEPSAPPVPILTCPEPTFEGLCKLFAVGLPALGVFAHEGGQFIGGYGFSADAKLRTAAGLSALWDGEPIKRVRSGEGVTILGGRRLSMHLLAQPDVASGLLADPVLLDQGLLSRWLVVAPESESGRRSWQEMSPQATQALGKYRGHLEEILSVPFKISPQAGGSLMPRPLIFTAPARELWIDFYNFVEEQLRVGGEFASIISLANKLPEHAVRIAGVLRLVREIDSKTIEKIDLEAGIDIALHHASEANRLVGICGSNKGLLLAQQLLEWLDRWPHNFISLPDIYQKGPPNIRDRASAIRNVRILEEHGYLRRANAGTVVAGVSRRDVWLINHKTKSNAKLAKSSGSTSHRHDLLF